MNDTSRNLNITVLIPTYNRAEILRETLEAMLHVGYDGLAVEFVVIDNNSSDHTKQVVESFAGCLPIRYLFESRPGKNCALNKALDTVDLGKVVVFTDDDVTPQSDWLVEITASFYRHGECAIGGGKVIAVWPGGTDPAWLHFTNISCGLRGHAPWSEERHYPAGNYPTGGNLWIGREVFADGWRYDETIGPSPVNRAMGSETSLLSRLRQAGYEMVYCPDSVVYHRMESSLVGAKGIRRRAYTMGRGSARMAAWRNSNGSSRHPVRWRVRCVGALGFALMRLVRAYLQPISARRIGYSLEPIADVAYNLELLGGKRRSQDIQGEQHG